MCQTSLNTRRAAFKKETNQICFLTCDTDKENIFQWGFFVFKHFRTKHNTDREENKNAAWMLFTCKNKLIFLKMCLFSRWVSSEVAVSCNGREPPAEGATGQHYTVTSSDRVIAPASHLLLLQVTWSEMKWKADAAAQVPLTPQQQTPVPFSNFLSDADSSDITWGHLDSTQCPLE